MLIWFEYLVGNPFLPSEIHGLHKLDSNLPPQGGGGHMRRTSQEYLDPQQQESKPLSTTTPHVAMEATGRSCLVWYFLSV